MFQKCKKKHNFVVVYVQHMTVENEIKSNLFHKSNVFDINYAPMYL